MKGRQKNGMDTDGHNGAGKRSGGGSTAAFRGYINATPTPKDRADFDGWISQDGLFLSGLDECIQRGYKLTVTYESSGGYYRATLANWRLGDANAGLVLSLSAGTADRAIQRAVFWLVWKLGYKLEAPPPRQRDDDSW